MTTTAANSPLASRVCDLCGRVGTDLSIRATMAVGDNLDRHACIDKGACYARRETHRQQFRWRTSSMQQVIPLTSRRHLRSTIKYSSTPEQEI